jgi:hypothetical protein
MPLFATSLALITIITQIGAPEPLFVLLSCIYECLRIDLYEQLV